MLHQNFTIKKEIDFLSENIERSEAKLNAAQLEFKTSNNELSTKVKVSEQTIDELTKQNKHVSIKLNTTLAEYKRYQDTAVTEKNSLVEKLNKTLVEFTAMDTEHKKFRFTSENLPTNLYIYILITFRLLS